MRYFSKVTNGVQCQNNLQKKIQEYLQMKNRKIIHHTEIYDFMREINDTILEMNAANIRCKPIEETWWQPDTPRRNDWCLSLYFVSITIYEEVE